MRGIPVYLTALCLTLGASAAFAGTTPAVRKTQTKTTTTTSKPVHVTTKAAAHHHHRHHQHPRPATKKS